MQLGISIFPTDYSIRPAELAVEVEARGFQALLFPEHTHIPASRLTPYPGGGDLPKEYYHTFDPFVGLAQAAAVTTTLEIGTGICLVVERDPIILAKEVASLDFLSDGRFLFGIGGGWNHEEMKNHGTDPTTRWRLLDERVDVLNRIWSNEVAEADGKFVKFGPMYSWPKPKQVPRPPILLGANGASALERAVRIADEWMPIPTRLGEAGLAPWKLRLETLCEAAGRPPMPINLYGGTPSAEAVEQYAELGVKRTFFWIPSVSRDEALPLLDCLAELIPRSGSHGR